MIAILSIAIIGFLFGLMFLTTKPKSKNTTCCGGGCCSGNHSCSSDTCCSGKCKHKK